MYQVAHTHANMIAGINLLGRHLLSRTLVTGSKIEYEMKKMVKLSLYWSLVILRSFCRLASFALPIFVLWRVSMARRIQVRGTYRSKNEIKYNKLSHGINLMSSLRTSARS